MELVRLTTFINLFPEKIARTNVRHSPRSVYETSTSIFPRKRGVMAAQFDSFLQTGNTFISLLAIVFHQ